MKRIKNIKITACAVIAFALLGVSCSKDSFEAIPLEQSFEEPGLAAERYATELAASETGWEFTLSGKTSGYFAGYLSFGESNTAQFIADAVAEEGEGLRPAQFSTGVRGTNPALVFPRGAFTDFVAGRTGLDSVFTFLAAKQDTIFLRGDQNGSQLILTKASAARAQAYQSGGILTTKAVVDDLMKLPKYFKRLELNGVSYDLHFRPDLKIVYIHYGGTERFKIHESYYAITGTGISLQKPLVDGINTVSYIDGLSVDLAAATMTASVNGVSVRFTNQQAPSAYDAAAARAFFEHPPRTLNFVDDQGNIVDSQRYSASLNGFTVDGVADGYGVRAIPGYQYMIFFHQFTDQIYGGLRIMLGNSLSPFGPAVVAEFSTGGAVRFVYYGHFGTPPSEVAAIIGNVTATFTESAGFYVIKSGMASYDLVAVSNGQKWIRFE